MKLYLLLTFATCCLISACREAQEYPLPESGVSLELARERATRLDELAYDLTLSIPDSLSDVITGRLVLSLDLSDADAPLVLDFRAEPQQIVLVQIGDKNIDYQFENEHLIISSQFLKLHENQITIEFIAGNLSLNRSEDYLYTLLVPDRASTAFPCFDQPDLKARYTLQLDTPAGWEAVANGPLAEMTEIDGRKKYAFRETAPISTYLFAFAAGKFFKKSQETGGRIMTMYYRETDEQKVAANAGAIFKLHADALSWLEAYTGIPYPFEKFDFVLLPGFQYGGMEHVGSIFYREPSLFLDESATENQLLGRARLIAHETAHMWFGDLVTMKWFDDVWLKEVFANFMAAKIVNPAFPDINHELSFLLSNQPAAYSEDRSEGAHPIQQELDNLKNAGSLYGRIIYQKAPVVMRQLEAIVGDTSFQEGLREYLRTYAFGNAGWDDLVGILDQRSPVDLKQWSQVWVKEAGMPELAARAGIGKEKMGKFQIQQLKTSASGSYWPQSTNVILFYEDSLAVIPVYIEDRRAEISALADYPAPAAFMLNGSAMSYGYFHLTEGSRQYLLRQLPRIEDPLLRGAGWMGLYEECLRGNLAPGDLNGAILAALPLETEPLNRLQLLENLHILYWQFLSTEERQAMADPLESLLWQLLEKTEKTGVKAAFFNTYQQIALSQAATGQLYAVWKGEKTIPGLPLSESDRIDLAAELALRLPAEADRIVQQQLAETANPDRKQRLEFIRPALSPLESVRDSFFYSLQDVDNRHYEPWVVDAVAYLHHPLRAAQAEKYILPGLEWLEEIQATGDIFFPRQWTGATLSGHQSISAAKIVRDFLAERPDYPYRLRNKILMAADLLFRAAEQQKITK